MPIFEYNGKKYNVRDEHIESFTQEFPEASTIMESEGKKYRVKSADYKAFISERPQPGHKALKPTESEAPDSSGAAEEKNLTEQEKTSINTGLERMKHRSQKTSDAFSESVETMREYHEKAPFGGGFTAEGRVMFDPKTGKAEKTYITPLGNRYADKGLADFESFRYRQAADISAGGQLRKANERLRDITERLDARGRELLEEQERNRPKGFMGALARIGEAEMSLSTGAQTPEDSFVFQNDTEYQSLRLARRQLEEQVQQLKNYSKKENKGESFLSDFARNAWQKIYDIDAWDFGKNAFRDASTRLQIANKARQGEELTEAENDALYEMYMHDNVMQRFGDLGTGAKWGDIAGGSLSFMKDFLLTGGFEGVSGKLAAKIPSKLAAKAAKRLSLDATKSLGARVAKEGLFSAIRQGGKGAAARLLAEQGLLGASKLVATRALGVTAEDLLLRAPLMAGTVQGRNTAAEIINTKLGPAVVDEDTGELRFADDTSWGEAAWETGADKIIENFSEMWGAHVPGMADVSKVFGARTLTAALLRATRPGAGTVLSKTSEFLGKVGVNGYFGEVGEEYYGQLWRTMLGLGSSKDADGGNLFFNREFHGDIWGGMAMSVGLTGGAVAGVDYAGKGARYMRLKHQLNKSGARAAEAMTPEVWDGMRMLIDHADNIDMCSIATQVMNDKEITDEQRKAVMEYMERSMVMRGYNLGEFVRKRDGEGAGPEAEELDQCYIDGYGIETAQEMADAKNMYEHHRKRALAIIEEESLAAIENDPSANLELLRDNEELLDYLNAKQVYDGMMQRVRDDIDGQIERSNAMVDARTNRTTGTIQPATMKQDDRRVYVINGNLVQYADGSGIDIEASDNSIIVRDAETGELEQVSPDAIFNIEEPSNPSEEKMTAAEAIRLQLAQEAAAKIDGVATFNPGDTYTITGEDSPIQVQIVANDEGIVDNGDGTVNVSDGTNIFPLAKETIQQQFEAANLARVAQFEERRAAENAAYQQAIEEESRPQYALNDLVSLRDENGNAVRGNITTDADADGRYEVYTEAPVNGKRVNLFTRDELDSMLMEHNGVAIEQPAENEGNNGGENIPENDNNAPQNIPAMQRIPKDMQGNPLYKQTDSDTAWDAIVEQTEGDEAMAQSVADGMVADKEAALKKAEKAKSKGGVSVAEKIAAEKERKDAIDTARQELSVWKKIAGTAERRKMEAEAERRRAAEEAAALLRSEEEKSRAEREEAARIEREALKGVPDISDDKPQDARKRGYRRDSGHKIDRQQPLPHLRGKEISVKFSDKAIVKGHVAIIEASELQPSHIQGNRNPAHFIDEAQPKERDDEASVMSALKIAGGIRPEEITSSVTAYTGAPSVNSRGEVIQGNNRSAALRLMWDSQKEQASIYKQYLKDHAHEFGLDAEDIDNVQNPVLVNMLDVDDAEAIELGQFVAQDTESGGLERIRPKNAVQKMGADMRLFADQLLNSTDEETSFAGLVDANGAEVLRWMNQLGYITPTQYKSAFNSKGAITAEAKNDLKGIMYHSVFRGGNIRLEEMFNAMPAKAQRAILATAFRDYESPNEERMAEEIQDSIRAYSALSQDEAFALAKNWKDARLAVEGWKAQYAMDDVTGESYLPAEKFSNFALHLATMYKGESQGVIQSTFKRLYDLIQGVQEENLFEKPDNTPRTLAQAIYETLNIIYDGKQRSDVLAGDSSASQRGQQGSEGNAATGERIENGERTADRAGSVEGDSGRSRDKGKDRGNQSEEDAKEINSSSLSADEAENLIADMEVIADIAPEIDLTIENWDALFGESGIVATPIGEVKMGENQFAKLMRQGREGKLGMIKPTLENPHAIVEETSEAKKGDKTERASSYIFIRSFKKADGSRYYYFTSITVSKDGKEVVVSSQEKSRNKILRLLREGSVIWRTPKDATTSSAERQGLDYEQPIEAETAAKGSGITPQSTSSEDKDNYNSQNGKELGVKIAEAEAETDINPTEAQKKAGNYKKGHIQVGTFDITIENPKGSVRSGVDAGGNKWETIMRNTYGYIRGTEGVDGDNIDVFLSDDIDGWNGRKVFVIDQYNEDGGFDEHKVMLGFNEAEEAHKAYLSNYEKDWSSKHKTVGTPINIEDFEKWIASSHRKTKPFSEYKSVRISEKRDNDSRLSEIKSRIEELSKEQEEAHKRSDIFEEARLIAEANELFGEQKKLESGASEKETIGSPEAPYSIAPAQYTTKKGKVLDMRLVKFSDELSEDLAKKASAFAKEMRGWRDRDKGGFMMRGEEDAKRLAEYVAGLQSKEAADTEKVSMDDIKAVNDGDVMFTEPRTATEERDDAPVWQYSVHIDSDGYTTLSRDDIRSGNPIMDGSFYRAAYTPEEMLEMLGNPQNGMQEVLEAVGPALENKIKTRELERKVREEKKREYEALRENGYNGYKIGDEVVYKGKKAKIHDLEEYGKHRPVLDVGLAPVMYVVADWSEIHKEGEKPHRTESKTPPSNPSGNRLVTDERYAELRERMLKKLGGQMNIGIDPEILAIGTEMAVYHLEKGARKFTEFAKAMIADLGDAIRPYLKAFYNGARNLPEVESGDIAADMTPYEEVKTFDVANFDKPGINALETAETVSREAEIEKEAEAARERIKKSGSTRKKNEKKTLNLQHPNDSGLFGGLFDNENDNEDGLQRTDAVRSEGLPTNGSRHEEELSRGSETGSGRERQDGRGADGRGEGKGSRADRPVRPRLPDTVAEKKNTHNNRSERGEDHAPVSVDARIDANIKAIELAKQLLESGEKATEKQMQTLRRFSGWGGLGKVFNERSNYVHQGRNYWNEPTLENKKLRQLLGEKAYQEAVMSANSAYYTPAYIVDTLWDIAEKMGFEGGSVLEGSAGIGNILGQMPVHISERSDIRAIEIDGTSGGILSLLYPDADVEIQGFEQTRIANGSVDLAITNVPFVTGLRVNDTAGDKDLSKKFHNIHDFCIAKNVRKLREGGLGIFITSNGTLDSSKKLRDWIVGEGGSDFVGAFRLNNKTFGGTPVTSDIIVIRKRVNGRKSANAIDVSAVSGERMAEYKTGETRKVKGKETPVIKQLSMDYNSYFIEHPENMAGEMRFGFEKGDTYRPASKGLYPKQGKNQERMLEEFVQSFSAEELGERTENETGGVAEAAQGRKLGEVFVKDGRLYTYTTQGVQPLDVNANKVKGRTKVECFEAYAAIKEALAEVLAYQTENESDEGLKPLLGELNRAYDDFVETYGHLNKNTAIAFLRNDLDYASVSALEKFEEKGDGKGGTVQHFDKTDVFSKRVIEKEKEPTPANVKDGIVASIFKFGRVDVPYIAEHLKTSAEEVKKEIIESGYGFENPATLQIEASYQYLSGNVREKLRQAEENNENGTFSRNIKALQAVMPMEIPAHLIDFTLGSSWIDPKLYDEYVKERTDVSVRFASVGGTWFMKEPYSTNYEKNRAMGVRSETLDRTIMGHTLIEAAIQNRSVTVSATKKNWDGSTETITDKEATQACAAKIDEIRQDFKDWSRQKMQDDPEMSALIERVYNDTFNNFVPMSIPGEFVPEYFSGASHKLKMYPHQGGAIVRGTQQPLLLAHEVGTGKTFTLISTAMEMRRLGTARKPMIVVQNSTVGQFVASAKELYPNARILTLEESDRNAEGRKNFYAKIRYNDWDMIVVPQSTFEFIPDSEEREMAFVQDKIEEKMLILEKMKEEDPSGRNIVTRQAEREIELLEEELAGLADSSSKRRTAKDEKRRAVAMQNAEVRAMEMLDRRTDDVENFDDMGIDALLIDEAHEYKHLGFATAMQRGVKGVDPSYSKKSQGVFLKTQAVLEKNNGRNVIFATGTPVSNTAAEIWTFMRYLMPADTMKGYGIYYFDDFVRNFGNIQQMLEFTTSGKFKENNRFAGYVNLPELVRIWSGVSDTVLTKEAGDVSDKIPEMEGGKAQDLYLPQTRALRGIMKFVKGELERYDKMSGKEKKDNSHIPLTMYGIAKAAAVDARLVQADAEDDANSKTNEAVRQTLRALQETADYKGTVAIFADNYQNKHSGFNIYDDIRNKLIEKGVPADEIVVMRAGMTVNKKLEIFEKVNRGQVRVILGSTFTLGTGVNIQERLHTLIHLDAPNRPMDYTQRNGRILRQGNLHKEMGKPVRILRFGVEDSLDVTAYQRLKTKGAIADSIMNGKQMLSNSMTNRVLEEEEDVFGDTVAQLSGSEYAMLKNNAEKNVRKYTSRKKQYEADQTYIHNAKPRVKAFIKDAEKRIENNSRYLEAVSSAFPEGRFKEIAIGKHRFNSIGEMEDFFKEHNKGVLAEMKKMKDGEIAGEQKREIAVQIDGFSFIVTTKLTRNTVWDSATLFNDVERKMTYSCAELGVEDIPVRQNLLRNGVEDIAGNVITGKNFAERLEAAERNRKHNEAELAQLLSREGKPFEYEQELEQAQAQLEEYAKLMRKELEEKEAKYAEMDASVEAADDLASAEEDDDTLYREWYGGNSGYVGYSKSRRAADAEKNGLRNKSQMDASFANEVNDLISEATGEASNITLKEIKNALKHIKADEWHHTSKYGNRTDYYSAQTIAEHFTPADINEAEVTMKELAKVKDEINAFVRSTMPKVEVDTELGKRTAFETSDGYFVEIVPNITYAPEDVRLYVAGRIKSEGNGFEVGNGYVVDKHDDWFYSNRDVFEKAKKEFLAAYNEALKSVPESLLGRKSELDAQTGERTVQRAAELSKMAERVKTIAEKLRLDNVEIITDISTLDEKKQRAKGFYSKSAGKITVVIPNHSDAADAEQTLLHEAVGHYGLRKLFGEHFDTFLDNVFNNADEAVRRRIVSLAAKNGWDFRKATEEYLAALAEDTEFDNTNASWWQKIKDFFLDMLHKIGLEGFGGVTLSDNELRYILWRSYENLAEPGGNRGVLSEAADVAMQYELKVGNHAAAGDRKSTESESGDTLYRDGGPEIHERELARDRYERRVKSGMFQTQEALQDSMLGLREAMTAILGQDTYIEDVDGFENAYLGENRLSSVNKAEADAFARILFKPMLDEVAKLAKNEAERAELTDYMMAKHGLERNMVMAERDFDEYQKLHPNGQKTLDDFRERDYAGLTALTSMDSVAEAEAEAEQIVADYELAHETAGLWDKVNAVTKAILSKSYECGMMSKETFGRVSDMYEFYIPLRGFDEKTSADTYAYLTQRQSAFNAPIKKAEGRRSKADDPFANLQSMAESAIMQGNRNSLVKQRFLNFALNHPSDLVSVSDLWVEHDAVTDEWKPVFPDNIESADTPEEVERKMKDFETKMEALAQNDPARYKKGKDAIGIPYRIVESRDMRQHQVIVKRGGRDYVITINGNPRAAQALNGQTNPDNDMSGAIGAILRTGEKLNRQLSAFYTTRNPDFIVSNFIRDMLYTNIMAWVKESPNYALRFHRNYAAMNPVKMSLLLAKHRKGELDMNDKTEAMFHRFIMNGGETGYANIRDIERHKNDIKRELKRANGKLKIGRALSLLAERFDELNRAVENCARFAAFVTSREMGRSIDRAVYDAKEISVNFNKKGSGAKFYGSSGQTTAGNASALVSGLGRSGFVFWNAAIQGTTNFGRQMKRHPAKAFAGAAVMFLLGAVVAYLGGDEDEDDKNAYYNLPEYVRRSNILFRAGDSWISIPLPIEYRAMYGMGELMTSVLSGKEHLTGAEIAEAIAGQLTQVLPIDFLEGGGGWSSFVPSAAKPLVEAYVIEKSWTGMPLYKDTPWNKDMPEWTKAYKKANKHILNLAAALNDATGGDPYTKGAADLNPAKIEYMLNGYFGGVFGTIDKLSKMAETIAGDREYDPRSFLLVNRIVKSGDESTEYRAVNNEYFRLKEEHDRLKTRLRHYEEDTDNGIFDYAEKIDFLYNSPEYERYEIFEDYRRDIDSLYDELKEAVDDEERKDIEAELNKLKKEMIKEMNTTRKRK